MWMLSPRSPEHVQPQVGQIRCVSSSCLPPSHVRIVLMAESFREANQLSQSSEGPCCDLFRWSLAHRELSVSWVRWLEKPLCIRASACTVFEGVPQQNQVFVELFHAGRPSWLIAPFLKGDPPQANQAGHERSVVSSVVLQPWSEQFFQKSSRLRARIDPIVATLYFLRRALFHTWVTCAATLAQFDVGISSPISQVSSSSPRKGMCLQAVDHD